MRGFLGTGSGIALALAIAAGGWAAAAPSGVTIAVIQSSEADGQFGRRMLAVEAPVFSGDDIITGSVGEAQIRFHDGTRLVVGPNSLMTIDAFVFDDTTASDFSIDTVRGAFRFITGNGPKDAYSITTPTAVIGVRGTEFDVNVEATTGVTRVANFTGTTRICQRSDAEIVDPNDPERHLPRCIESSNPCGVSIVRPERGIYEYRDQRDRNRELAHYFRYVGDQTGLLSDFQVSTERCGDLSVPEPPRSDDSYPLPPKPVSPH